MKKLAATSAMALALAISVNTAQAADLYEAQVQELVVSGYVDSWIGGSFLSNVTGDNNPGFGPDHDSYLTSGQWEGKAGAFGYQDGHDWLRVVEGSESNVVGLPLELLRQMLRLFPSSQEVPQ